MRFKVSMDNELFDCHEEAVITNNETEAKKNMQTFNSKSKVLKSILVYK